MASQNGLSRDSKSEVKNGMSVYKVVHPIAAISSCVLHGKRSRKGRTRSPTGAIASIPGSSLAALNTTQTAVGLLQSTEGTIGGVIGGLNGILSLLGSLVGGQLGIVNSTMGSAEGEVNSIVGGLML